MPLLVSAQQFWDAWRGEMLNSKVVALLRSGVLSLGVAAAVLTALVRDAPAQSDQSRILLVATSPPSYNSVAHAYDTTGRLLSTVRGRAGQQLTWSPDGSAIAVADRGGIVIEHSDGTGARQLIQTKTSCSQTCIGTPVVAWSPDGRRVAVGGVDPKTQGFDLIDVRTGKLSRIAVPERGGLYLPIAFSPDGQLLSYTLLGGTPCCSRARLFVARPDGSRRRVLHRFVDSHDSPGIATWSPDSTQVAFTDDGRDTRDPRLAVVDVRTGKLRALNPRKIYDQSPAWSPDGKHLALTQFKGQAFTVSTSGADFYALGIMGTVAWWLRNNDLLVSRGLSNHAVAVLRGGRGTARTLFTLPYREQVLSMREAVRAR
jgi:Tol biopolymer transport system component